MVRLGCSDFQRDRPRWRGRPIDRWFFSARRRLASRSCRLACHCLLIVAVKQVEIVLEIIVFLCQDKRHCRSRHGQGRLG